MKKVTMWKLFSRNVMTYGVSWCVEYPEDWASTPDLILEGEYEVEIPDEFELCETNSGEKKFFKGDDSYELSSWNKNNINSIPCLIGEYVVKCKISRKIR